MLKEKEKSEILNDLYLFYRVFITSDYADDVEAEHIDILSQELTMLHLGDVERLCVAMPPRHKLADSTPVLTLNKGWTTHGDLEVGDYVFGSDGEPTRIIGVSDKSLCDKLITFSDGSKILAHEDHLWSVFKRGNKNIKILSTSDMEKDYKYYENNGKKRYRYHLPLINPIQYDDVELPIDPYWLGYWLGDGTYNKPCITHPKEDSQFIDNVPYEVSSQSIHKDTGVYTTYFAHQRLLEEIRKMDLYENKHIPEIYKKSSINQRLQLLAGLIDSDGNVDKHGRVRFSNVNKKLIDDYYELCVGLGLYPYRMSPVAPEKINDYKKNSKSLQILSKQTSYQIGFQPRYKIPTNVPRKKIVERGLRRRLAITNIETVTPEMGKCIEIENSDGIYLCGEKLIPTHNSKSSMVTLAFPLWLIFQNPDLNILIINNAATLSEKFGIQLKEFIRQHGHYFNVYLSDLKHAKDHLMFERSDGQLCKGSIRLVGASGSITGQDADYIIIDDPYKGFEDITPTLLRKRIDWFDTIVEQRIEPHTKLVLLHTRWHTNDLQGFFKKNRSTEYKFVEFSAIKDDGTPLWPERYDIEKLEKKREAIGERLFQSIFQQKPIDDTADFFDLQAIHWENPDKNRTYKVRGWDTASSDSSKNDFTVGLPMYLLDDDCVLITDFVYGQFGKQTNSVIKNQVRNDGVDNISVIETGVAAAGELVYNEWVEQLEGYFVERAMAVPNNSKADRATPLKNAINDGKVYVNITDDTLRQIFIDEFKAFPNGEHDDIVDAAAHAYNYIKENYIGAIALEIIEL